MPKKSTKGTGFYGVKVGRVRGVYTTWDECQQQTSGKRDLGVVRTWGMRLMRSLFRRVPESTTEEIQYL